MQLVGSIVVNLSIAQLSHNELNYTYHLLTPGLFIYLQLFGV